MSGTTDRNPDLMDRAELQRRLLDLPGVALGDGALVVQLRAPSFRAAIQLVQLVADDAEQLNHHPDIDIRWRTVRFALTTHSAGGVTALDLQLARLVLRAGQEVRAEAVSSGATGAP